MNSSTSGAHAVEVTAAKRSKAPWSLLENYTVQQAATLTGLSEHTLRYYEKIGLITPVARQQSSGHRRYSAADLPKLEMLACLRAAGMPIDQMRRYFELRAGGPASAIELQQLLGMHLAELQRRMAELQGHINYVERKVDYWRAIAEQDDETAARIAREVDGLVRATLAERGS